MTEESFDELLSTLCDGQPSEELYEELGRRLSHDPAARQRYLDCMRIHAILQWDHALPAESRGAPRPEANFGNKRSPLLGLLPTDSPVDLTGWTRARYSLSLVLAAVLISSGLTGAAMHWQRNYWQAAAADRSLARPDAPRRTAEFVATLVD